MLINETAKSNELVSLCDAVNCVSLHIYFCELRIFEQSYLEEDPIVKFRRPSLPYFP